MHIAQIPKGNGKFRTIYVPNPQEKKDLKRMLSSINKKQTKILDKNIVHGFMPLRNPVTNAKMHIGYEYTLCFDLEDFFDSVTLDKFKTYETRLTENQKNRCFVDGAARQGLPTSPALANIAAWPMDRAIMIYIEKKAPKIVYTRYADDLSFSFNDPLLIKELRRIIPKIVESNGFKINQNKTKCQAAIAGRRIICGVAVDFDNIYPTRKSKRKLRAALHQKHMRSAQGLKEWTKLKEPVVFDANEQINKTRDNLNIYNIDTNFSLNS